MRQVPNPKTGRYTSEQRITAAEYALINMAESVNQGGKIRKIINKIQSIRKESGE